MREHLTILWWRWLACVLALAAFAVHAEVPPPAEFWNYLLEFSDDGGDVFDPNDLAVTAHVQPNKTDTKSAAPRQPDAAGAVKSYREVDPAPTPAGEPTP